jgi:hypothetical protein
MDSASNKSEKEESPQISPRGYGKISSKKSSEKADDSEPKYEIVGEISDRDSGNFYHSDSKHLGLNESDPNSEAAIGSLGGDMPDSDKGSQKSETIFEANRQINYELKEEADSDEKEDSKSQRSEPKESDKSDKVSNYSNKLVYIVYMFIRLIHLLNCD